MKLSKKAMHKLAKRVVKKKSQPFKPYVATLPAAYRANKIPSTPDAHANIVAQSKSVGLRYTGDYVTGLGQLHKSNSIPVTRDDADLPKDIANMRRSTC